MRRRLEGCLVNVRHDVRPPINQPLLRAAPSGEILAV
jgi:hypothetical protein